MKNDIQKEIDAFIDFLFKKLEIKVSFGLNDFEDEIVCRQWEGFYILDEDFVENLLSKIKADDCQIIYIFREEKSNPIAWITFGRTFRGKAVVDIPVNESLLNKDYLWRVLFHEFNHACFRILNLKDLQDQVFVEYRKNNPNPTEDQLTQLAVNVFNLFIKPYLKKKESLTGILGILSRVLMGLVLILNKLLEELKKKNKEKVIERLAKVIAKQEGFYVPNSRAQRNHNPGNLIYVGQSKAIGKDDAGFAIFSNDEDGWEALKWQLDYIFEGKSKYYKPEMTIEEFVNVWASTSPLEEKKAYAKAIADEFKVDVKTPLKELN